MHKPLDIDQASLEAVLSTGHKENLTWIKVEEKAYEMRKQWQNICTPVALCVKVSLFSTPNTLILCKVPTIR